MKKRRNFAAAILLASMMAVSTCAATALTAVAEGDPSSVANSTHTAAPETECTHTLTIKQPTDDQVKHTYNVYQIFTGNFVKDESENVVLINVAWGESVTDKEAFVQALLDNFSDSFKVLKNNDNSLVTDPAKVAKALSEANVDGQKLARVLNKVGMTLPGVMNADNEKNPTKYTAEGLHDGWYFVNDVTETAGTKSANSANLLQLVGDTEINPKYTLPTLTKKIVENNQTKDANQVSIGDVVTYQITVPVPDMTGYDKYYYYVEDTLSKGLTFKDVTSVVIENGTGTDDDNTLTKDDATIKPSEKDKYYVEVGQYDSENGTKLKLVFEDCIRTFAGQSGNVVITYTAVLNQNAVLTEEGNPNTAKLIYSNNPNFDYRNENDDKPDEPDEPTGPNDKKPVGETPEDTVKTFTTGLELQKVIAGTNTPLAGAVFSITGETVKAVLVNGQIFKEDTNGTYYQLKDYSFTTDAPAEGTEDKYLSTGTKYSKVSAVDATTAPTTNSVNQIGVSDKDGVILFTGLGAGTYTIEEIQAPKGYNKLSDTFNVKIESALDQDAMTCTWTVKKGDQELADVNGNHHFEFTVENHKGTTLPSTGGIGTTIFYVVGGTLVAGAVVMLITKKRMSVSDQK